jgi:hypothetical protein
MICSKFHWNWPAGSEDFFKKKNSVYFYSFSIIFPWRRGLSFIWTILNHLYLRMVCAVLGTIGPVVLVKRSNKLTDDGQRMIRKAHLSFQLRWAKKKKSKRLLLFGFCNTGIQTIEYDYGCYPSQTLWSTACYWWVWTQETLVIPSSHYTNLTTN